MFNVETQTVEMERAVVNFTPDQVREALLDKLRGEYTKLDAALRQKVQEARRG